jgi:hypothetical protein
MRDLVLFAYHWWIVLMYVSISEPMMVVEEYRQADEHLMQMEVEPEMNDDDD